MKLRRLLDEPIISPSTHPSIGSNIQGPSLIRVPDWVTDPLGTYYLYFADHKGDHIRLAFADELTGPWTVHPGGALQLADSGFLLEPPAATDAEVDALHALYRQHFGEYEPLAGIRSDVAAPHIASPDVRVNEATRQIELYVHGLESLGWQVTRHGTSADGLSFAVGPAIVAETYLRAFSHGGAEYAFVMPGKVLRRQGGPTDFAEGPVVFPATARHSAVRVVGDQIQILWSRVGDAPERLLLSTIDASAPWTEWTASDPIEVLRPERPWEGALLANQPSVRSVAPDPVNQLRDPAFFHDLGRTYVVYAVAGEHGLAIAEVVG